MPEPDTSVNHAGSSQSITSGVKRPNAARGPVPKRKKIICGLPALTRLLERADTLSSPQEFNMADINVYDVSEGSFGRHIGDEQHVSRLREAFVEEVRAITGGYTNVLEQVQANLQKDIDKLLVDQQKHSERVKNVRAQAAKLDVLVARQPPSKAIEDMLKALRIMEQVSTSEATQALHTDFLDLCAEHEVSQNGMDYLVGLEKLETAPDSDDESIY